MSFQSSSAWKLCYILRASVRILSLAFFFLNTKIQLQSASDLNFSVFSTAFTLLCPYRGWLLSLFFSWLLETLSDRDTFPREIILRLCFCYFEILNNSVFQFDRSVFLYSPWFWKLLFLFNHCFCTVQYPPAPSQDFQVHSTCTIPEISGLVVAGPDAADHLRSSFRRVLPCHSSVWWHLPPVLPTDGLHVHLIRILLGIRSPHLGNEPLVGLRFTRNVLPSLPVLYNG